VIYTILYVGDYSDVHRYYRYTLFGVTLFGGRLPVGISDYVLVILPTALRCAFFYTRYDLRDILRYIR